MKKNLRCRDIVKLLLGVALIVYHFPVLPAFAEMSPENKSMITLSGVILPEKELPNGEYTLWIPSHGSFEMVPMRAINGPDFSYKVPADSGLIRINLGYRISSDSAEDANRVLGAKSIPVRVEASDINLGRVILDSPDMQPYMDTYYGRTVTLSGNISMKDYTYGVFDIYVSGGAGHNPEAPKPDILFEGPFLSPAAFEVKVPSEIGEVYITGVYHPLLEDFESRAGCMPGVRYSASSEPVNVGDEDIPGLIILFE